MNDRPRQNPAYRLTRYTPLSEGGSTFSLVAETAFHAYRSIGVESTRWRFDGSTMRSDGVFDWPEHYPPTRAGA